MLYRLVFVMLLAGCGQSEKSFSHSEEAPTFITKQGAWVYDKGAGLNVEQVITIIEVTVTTAAKMDPGFDETRIRQLLSDGWPEITLTTMTSGTCGNDKTDAFGCYIADRTLWAGVLHSYDLSSNVIPHELCHFFVDTLYEDMGHPDLYFGPFGISDEATFALMELDQ